MRRIDGEGFVRAERRVDAKAKRSRIDCDVVRKIVAGIVVGTDHADIELVKDGLCRECVGLEQGISTSPNGFGIALAEQFRNAEIAF